MTVCVCVCLAKLGSSNRKESGNRRVSGIMILVIYREDFFFNAIHKCYKSYQVYTGLRKEERGRSMKRGRKEGRKE